jgi:predicted DNA-binding protein YlxM (UPF0122 family)
LQRIPSVSRVLLENNRKIKARENRLSMAEIAERAGISRVTFYRIREKIEREKMPPLQIRLPLELLEKYRSSSLSSLICNGIRNGYLESSREEK